MKKEVKARNAVRAAKYLVYPTVIALTATATNGLLCAKASGAEGLEVGYSSQMAVPYNVLNYESDLEIGDGKIVTINVHESNDLAISNGPEFGVSKLSDNTAGFSEYEELVYEEVMDPLIVIDNVDTEYKAIGVELSSSERDLAERIVMGEAGDQGYVGAALVAQAIRDALTYDGYETVADMRVKLKYSGRIDKEPNDNVKRAVQFIFDDLGNAVNHKVLFFYAPRVVDSEWHETQEFVVEYKGHRFFDRWD